MRFIFMCWFIGLCFIATIAFSQDVEVKNVIAAQNFNDIIVSYDLLSENESLRYTVSLYCSTNGGKVFGDPLRNAKGDVGFSISPGEEKTITWDVLEELNQFVYDDVVFKVAARANTSAHAMARTSDVAASSRFTPVRTICISRSYSRVMGLATGMVAKRSS